MRPTKRLIALGLASVLLAACGHKDKDAPLAFVPADTPYVMANLDKLDDDAYEAIVSQANTELPGQVAQMKSLAQDLEAKGNVDGARLLKAFAAEFDGKTAEAALKNMGLDIKTGSAIYGLGLSPVARVALADPAAWDAFVGRLETAYGKKLDSADAGGQAYRHVALSDSGLQLVIATVGKQAVVSLLPADAAQPMIRQALGADRPEKNLQDDGRLADLAKDKGYKDYAGQLDLVRLLPLVAAGKDPLFSTFLKHQAQQTGEPVPALPPSCTTEASRIAARVPSISFGYTRLDMHHQEQRVDVALADDITKAFSGLKVEVPGLGKEADGPFDVSLALPMEQIRTFFTAQAEAVAAKPFECPAFASMNDSFAKLGSTMQQAAIPPIGDIRGLRVVLDSFTPAAAGQQMPKFTGRVLLGTRNPAGLVAMGQAMLGGDFKLTGDGKPTALPQNITGMLGMPGWAAMNGQAIVIGVGDGEDAKLDDMLMASTGDAGRLSRMHLNGDMYRNWVDLMADKAQSYADAMSQAAGADGTDGADGATDDSAKQASAADRSKAQFEAMKAQAARIVQVSGESHMDEKGLVISGAVEYK
ncbi:hypothetical protein IM816_13160 [Luteibacter flocculans]|uniref:DUF3352 domain-containing protein n=1 Tax=Luteibacter flocculans TaxID=2780091 RepID=A0ABY4T3T1_9GAMM|nr:hypothetical protein [Luteibacter flocculans]URL57564.1 hypothetical protein IM816_13160 [Luteibacter flocculans]